MKVRKLLSTLALKIQTLLMEKLKLMIFQLPMTTHFILALQKLKK